MIQDRFVAIPSKRRLTFPLFVSALAIAACSHQSDIQTAAPQAPGSAAAPANVMVEPPPSTPAAAPAPAASAEPAMEPAVTLKDVGLLDPESALYDAEQDVYFVSSINGKPDDADGNGFISKIGPDGKVLELKWIDGTKKTSALNAPKGLGVAGGVLYVADLTFVRMFDAKTGAPKGKIAIPGATFLNDIATGADGTVYVSDSGIKFGKDGVEATGSDSVYAIKGGHAKKLIASKDLGHPNGLLADDKGVWVVTFGSGELYHVGKDGKKDDAQKLPSGSLDGIVKLADGTVLISSWESSSVLRGTAGGAFASVIPNLKSPADIGYDTKRDIVLIPQMQLNTLALQKLPGGAPVPAAAAPMPVAPPPAAPAPAPAANAKPPVAPATPVAATAPAAPAVAVKTVAAPAAAPAAPNPAMAAPTAPAPATVKVSAPAPTPAPAK